MAGLENMRMQVRGQPNQLRRFPADHITTH